MKAKKLTYTFHLIFDILKFGEKNYSINAIKLAIANLGKITKINNLFIEHAYTRGGWGSMFTPPKEFLTDTV